MAGNDLLACAMTGSGKTAAFLLPILHRLIDRPRGVTRALVLTPTRELAAQIAEDLNDLAVHTPLTAAAVYGGVGMGPQEHAFRSGVDVLIPRPGHDQRAASVRAGGGTDPGGLPCPAGAQVGAAGGPPATGRDARGARLHPHEAPGRSSCKVPGPGGGEGGAYSWESIPGPADRSSRRFQEREIPGPRGDRHRRPRD